MASSRAASVRRVSGLFAAAFQGKGLLGHTVRTMGISVAILIVNVATGMITARMLGPIGRGDQAAMILWPQFLAFAVTFGLPTSLLYHTKKTPDDEGSLFYGSLILAGLTSLTAMTIGLFLIPVVVSNHPSSIIPGQWFLLVIPLMHFFFLNNALFRAREEFHLFNRMRYLLPLLTLVLLLLFIAAGRLTPVTSSLAYLAPYVPITGWALYRGLSLYRPKLRMMRASLRRLLHYGAGSYGIDLMGNLILYVDQILLIGLLAPEALGLYVVAVSLSRMVNVFSNSIIMVLFPKATGLEEQEAALLSLRVYKLSTAIAFIGATLIMLASPLVIRLLYGEAFAAAIPVFRLLLLDVVIGGSVFVLGQSFMAAGKPSVMAFSQAIGIAMIVPLLYVLVPQYGLMGAGTAMLSAAIVRWVYILIRFERKFRLGYRALWISSADCRWFMEQLKARRK